MSKQIISTAACARRHRRLFAGRARRQHHLGVRPDSLGSRDQGIGQRRHRGAGAPGIRQLEGHRGCGRRELGRRGQGDGVPDRPVALRDWSTRSWPNTFASPILRAPPSAWPRCRAERRLKWSALSLSSAGDVTAAKPVTVLRGVGEALSEGLRALGVETTEDLLFLLPLRYEDRTRVVPLGELRAGQRAAVEGEVQLTEVVFRGRRQMLCRIADGSGFLTLRFFYFTAQQQNGLARGVRIRCFGEARRGPMGLEIVHPEYRRIDPAGRRGAGGSSDADLSSDGGGHPGTSAHVGGLGTRRRPVRATSRTGCPPPSWPIRICPPCAKRCSTCIARPADAPWICCSSGRHPAQRRLAFEELLAHQLSLKLLRQRIQSDPGWPLAVGWIA